jgi:class 3 adenylate cyclase
METPDVSDSNDWAAFPNEEFHPIFGFDAELEPHYLVHLHKSFGTVVAMVFGFVVFVPLAMATGASKIKLEDGWGYTSVFATFPFLVAAVGALFFNKYKNHDALSKANVEDKLVSFVGVVILLATFHATFETNNQCVHGELRDDPTLTQAELREICVTNFATFVYMVFLVTFACNIRPVVMYPLLPMTLAVTYIGLLYLTDPNINTETQLIARAVIYVVVFVAIAAGVRVMDKNNRSSFLLFKRVVLLTEQTTETANQINGLLEAMLPESVLQRVAAGDDRIFDMAKIASVSYSDVAGFTNWSSQRTSTDVVQMVSTLVGAYDIAARECQVSKVKTIGDAYWAISGLPEPTDECAVRICNFALRQQELLADLNLQNPQWNNIELRVGCHSGALLGGVIGTQQLAYEVFGETNHVAELHEQKAPRGGVLVSERTAELAAKCAVYRFTLDDAVVDDAKTFVVTRCEATSSPWRTREAGLVAFAPGEILGGREDRASVMRFFGLGKVKPPSHHSVSGSMRSARSARSVQMTPRESNYAVQEADDEAAPTEMTEVIGVDEVDDSDDEDPDVRTKKVCCAIAFDDPDIEEEFYNFDNGAKKAARQVTSGTMAAAGGAFILAIFIELPPERLPEAAASIALFTMTAALELALFIAAMNMNFSRPQSKAFYMCCWLFEVIGYVTATELVPRDMFIASPWPIFAICNTCLYLSPPADVHVVLHAVENLIGGAYVSYVARHGNSVGYNALITLGIVVFAFVWYGIVQDKRDRARFVTQKLAARAATVARSEEALQRQILASMAPLHVQDDMVKLVTSAAFRAGEAVSIAHTLPNVTVCFCKIRTKDRHDDAQDAYEDIMGMHQRVEACLQKYPLAIKIKSIGSTLVVAGPLHEDATEEEVAAAANDVFKFAYDVLHSFRAADGTHGLALRAGVSTGPVVATVMGTDRVAYDIFGDTVNTSSRCMSTAAIGAMQSPVDKKEYYGRENPGEVVQVFMKGKGDVAVYRC